MDRGEESLQKGARGAERYSNTLSSPRRPDGRKGSWQVRLRAVGLGRGAVALGRGRRLLCCQAR